MDHEGLKFWNNIKVNLECFVGKPIRSLERVINQRLGNIIEPTRKSVLLYVI